jgi:hypothetical protein
MLKQPPELSGQPLPLKLVFISQLLLLLEMMQMLLVSLSVKILNLLSKKNAMEQLLPKGQLRMYFMPIKEESTCRLVRTVKLLQLEVWQQLKLVPSHLT